MNDLWVYVGEGIGVYFEIFLAGESMPGSGMSRLEKCQEIIC